jgi:hypothetical protein
METLHTHERTGDQVRAELAPVIAAIERHDLTPTERVAVLEYVETAYVAERRHGQNAGAAYLEAQAALASTTARQRSVLRRCATSFIRAAR